MLTRWWVSAFFVAFVFGPLSYGEEPAKPSGKFYGATKCKSCHSAPAKGNQYGVWLKMKHAKAFETLASEEAKKLGKEKGVADPQTSDKCLKCHVTAFGVDKKGKHKKFDMKLGVQCESCHGPGEKHVKARLMGEDPPKDKPLAIPAGEIGTPTMETCKACHNDTAPNYKPICFKEAAKKTAHLDPRKKRAADYFDKLPCDCPKCKAGGEGDKK